MDIRLYSCVQRNPTDSQPITACVGTLRLTERSLFHICPPASYGRPTQNDTGYFPEKKSPSTQIQMSKPRTKMWADVSRGERVRYSRILSTGGICQKTGHNNGTGMKTSRVKHVLPYCVVSPLCTHIHQRPMKASTGTRNEF